MAELLLKANPALDYTTAQAPAFVQQWLEYQYDMKVFGLIVCVVISTLLAILAYGAYKKTEDLEPAIIISAFQVQKTLDLEERKKIAKAETFKKSKKMGYAVKLRKDWEEIKIEVMKEVLRAKFQDEELKNMLLGTGDAELIEGNDWGDDYWGTVDGRGQNHLGKCLMQIREELKSGNTNSNK